jgi:hypothetical protein
MLRLHELLGRWRNNCSNIERNRRCSRPPAGQRRRSVRPVFDQAFSCRRTRRNSRMTDNTMPSRRSTQNNRGTLSWHNCHDCFLVLPVLHARTTPRQATSARVIETTAKPTSPIFQWQCCHLGGGVNWAAPCCTFCCGMAVATGTITT